MMREVFTVTMAARGPHALPGSGGIRAGRRNHRGTRARTPIRRTMAPSRPLVRIAMAPSWPLGEGSEQQAADRERPVCLDFWMDVADPVLDVEQHAHLVLAERGQQVYLLVIEQGQVESRFPEPLQRVGPALVTG